jgi:hypothetical protein
MSTLIRIADALPENHPLKEKAIKLALLHGCLIENKNLMKPEARKWYEDNIKRMGAKFPPPPEPKPTTPSEPEPKPEPKPKLKAKPKPKAKFKVKPKEFKIRIKLEPTRMPYGEGASLIGEQWVGQVRLKDKWSKWARKRYGLDASPTIKDGIVTKLTDKLIGDREFVEAYTNSPFSSLYETADDALKDKETLRKQVYGLIDGLVGAWAQTASDHHPLVWALQIAIAQEFGLKERYEEALKRLRALSGSGEAPYLAEEAAFLYDTLKPILHKYVRAVYDETQEFLKETGLEELYLMRGVGLTDEQVRDLSKDEFKLVEPSFLPASSWALEIDTASWFARWMARKYNLNPVLYMIRIPKEAFHLILSTALTGWGCFNESEVVLAVPEGQEVWAARLG